MSIRSIDRHSLEYFCEYEVQGVTIVLADEGYEDGEGFMKASWSFGFWANEKTYYRISNIDGLGSFSSIGKARSVFEGKMIDLFSTYRSLFDEQTKVA
jgi:hypothetical protein